MAQAIKFDPDEEMKIDPDKYKDNLRAESYILGMTLKSTGSGAGVGVKIDKFPNATIALSALHQIPILQG